MNRPIRATTALAATLSILLPQAGVISAAHAQEAIRLCEDLETAPPCPDGQPRRGTRYIRAEDGSLTPAPRRGEDAAAEEQPAEEQPAEETAPDEAVTEVPAEEADGAAEDAQAAEDAARAERRARREAEAQAAAEQAAAEQAAAEQAAAEQAAAEEQAAQDEAAAAEEEAAREARRAERQAQIQAEAEAQAAAEEEAARQAAEEAAAEDAAGEQAAEERPAEEAAPSAEDEAARQQRRAERRARLEAEAEAQAQAEAEQRAAEEAAQSEEEARAAAEEEAAREARRAERRAQRAAEAAQEGDPTVDERPSEAAAAAAEEDAPDAEEEVVTVDEGDVRRSEEDFDTSVAEASREGAGDDDGDSGLSDLEKALLVGLGAVAVGAILNNGNEVVANSGDRVVTRAPNGDVQVYRDDDALLRQQGSTVRTQTFDDGSTRTIITRPNGVQIVTIRDAEGRVLRRARVLPDGTQQVLLDDTEQAPEAVDVAELVRVAPPPVELEADVTDRATLAAAIRQGLIYDPGRTFSLRQVREIEAVRDLVPAIDLSAITFPSGSAAIPADQVPDLVDLGLLIEEAVADDPTEVFLIEGHTDAVGTDVSNLALSDRRAESVALALTENFDIPAENLVVQGYGEKFLKVATEADEPENRRAVVRRITPLLTGGSVG